MCCPPHADPPQVCLLPDLECSICVEVMVEVSVLEVCGHRFCSHCIHTWHETSLGLTCPLCRAESSLPPVFSKEWSDAADKFVANRWLELQRVGLSTLAETQKTDREDRRRAWKDLSTALSKSTPTSRHPNLRIAIPAEERLARLDALSPHLSSVPDLWRGEAGDENLARRRGSELESGDDRATPSPTPSSAASSGWSDVDSRERAMGLLERMRAGNTSPSVLGGTPPSWGQRTVLAVPSPAASRRRPAPEPLTILALNAFDALPANSTSPYAFPTLPLTPSDEDWGHHHSRPTAIPFPIRRPLTPPHSHVPRLGPWASRPLPRNPSSRELFIPTIPPPPAPSNPVRQASSIPHSRADTVIGPPRNIFPEPQSSSSPVALIPTSSLVELSLNEPPRSRGTSFHLRMPWRSGKSPNRNGARVAV